MTTRRDLLILAGAVAGLTACEPPRHTPVTTVPDRLIALTTGGPVIVDGSTTHRWGVRSAVSPDGSYVYAMEDETLTGPAANAQLEAGWVPEVVSADGTACVLRRPGSLLVTHGENQKRLPAAGNIQADAFTADTLGLFVLEWLPAEAPDHYRVRLMDLATGALSPLLTRDKQPLPPGAEEEMRGEGRHAVLSPDRTVLYTLYTHQPGHRHTRDLLAGRRGNVHAFVHVLHLEQRWAYCLDLPYPFGEGPAESHAIAVDPAGRRLAVADLASGSLAYADTHRLAVTSVISVPQGAGTAAVALDASRTFLGAGPAVTLLEGGTTSRWTLPSPLRGLQLNPGGDLLYAGGTDEVVWLGATSGTLRGRVGVPGLTNLRHVLASQGRVGGFT
ncbi:hypothetical protein COUCH_34485 [Couchioplanes caeruleus]|uniref:hypothetical protein n=1 Tax=Couchioplanes caeruleus TaxID=56438 RepID=UPI0020BF7BA5|nr:hypothetical protein [Couchioplanes caeruleus]UQU64028.1 hypothetical protein COUCH_34485 [Couchioplanes caeruleus]